MIHVTASAYADALDIDRQTAYRRIRNADLPYIKGRNGERHYLLSRVLPTVRPSELRNLPRLFASATDSDAPMPADSEAIADKLEGWMDQRNSKHETSGPGARLAHTRRAYCQHLADSMKSTTLLRHSEYLRKVLILDDAILKYCVLGDAGFFPSNFNTWAVEWAITHAPQAHIGKGIAA